MGVWGTGLYSGDFACDLRSTISAISRLPFDGDKILEIARDSAEGTADDASDGDHTSFWFVIADQFQKRGIHCEAAREKALSLIDVDADNDMMRALGMTEADLRKRKGSIAELRTRLAKPAPPRKRRTLAKPQPFVMNVGDVLCFPTSRGQAINPYSADSKRLLRWVHDAWAALLVVRTGRAFDYLAWYTIMVVKRELYEKPSLETLLPLQWIPRGPGTCSSTHFRRMELEPIASLGLDLDLLASKLGQPDVGTWTAISDVSIANRMSVVSKNPSQPFVQRDLENARSIALKEIAT